MRIIFLATTALAAIVSFSATSYAASTGIVSNPAMQQAGSTDGGDQAGTGATGASGSVNSIVIHDGVVGGVEPAIGGNNPRAIGPKQDEPVTPPSSKDLHGKIGKVSIGPKQDEPVTPPSNLDGR